jgi:diguanylate cyclase (GGDEF)-like protein
MMQLKVFSFRLNSNLDIIGVSCNISDLDDGDSLLQTPIETQLQKMFMTDTFFNEEYVNGLMERLRNCFITKDSIIEELVVTDHSLQSDYHFAFNMGIDMYQESELIAILKFVGMKKVTDKSSMYESIIDLYQNDFSILASLNKVARFVIDYTVSPYKFYGNKEVPVLLDLKKEEDNVYTISEKRTSEDSNEFVRGQDFFVKAKMLIHNEIEYLEDEWEHKDKWLKMEAKAIKRDENGRALLVGGIIYDVTSFHSYKDIEYLHSIYELAITSGSIGVFYYDLDKYSNEYFEANKIYANMFGIDENKDGLYLTRDFIKTLMDIEEELRLDDNVMKRLNDLFSGQIDGTTDDILKIKNAKTGDIKYLLSSSKIDKRFENGTPKKMGGIVIDITDRIKKEKDSVEFAYRDELTMLPNNRKLMSDMKDRKKGIGLFFDLDDFKKVNDRFGHFMGDRSLRVFADALKVGAKQFDNTYPYRLYGDEFFVYCEGYEEGFAETFYKYISQYVDYYIKDISQDIKVEASYGVSVFKDGLDIDDFIKEADYEMYKHKIKRKSNKKEE